MMEAEKKDLTNLFAKRIAGTAIGAWKHQRPNDDPLTEREQLFIAFLATAVAREVAEVIHEMRLHAGDHAGAITEHNDSIKDLLMRVEALELAPMDAAEAMGRGMRA